MHLGTLMNHLASEDDAVAALDALGDIVLFSQVQAMGGRYEETPGEYVANAARRFAQLGSDEDWLGLMTVMERSDDPARAALERMLRWALKIDAEEATPAHTGVHVLRRCSPPSPKLTIKRAHHVQAPISRTDHRARLR